MPANAVVGLKPDTNNARLIELATSMVDDGATIHLVSLVQVGTDADEHERLNSVRTSTEAQAVKLRGQGYTVEAVVQISAVGLGSELARIASSLDADLLVIGLAKRTRVGKALLGSDAQAALMAAECPVLAARLD